MPISAAACHIENSNVYNQASKTTGMTKCFGSEAWREIALPRAGNSLIPVHLVRALSKFQVSLAGDWTPAGRAFRLSWISSGKAEVQLAQAKFDLCAVRQPTFCLAGASGPLTVWWLANRSSLSRVGCTNPASRSFICDSSARATRSSCRMLNFYSMTSS